MATEQIGLEAVLRDADFQRGLAAYIRGVDQATGKTQEGATGMSVMERASTALGSGLSTVATIAAGALTVGITAAAAAVAGFALAAKTGLDVTNSIANDLDSLGDKFGLNAEQAGGWAFLMKRVGLTVEEGSSGFGFFIRGLDAANDRLKTGKKELTPFEQSLKKLGISAFDTKGNLKTFEQVLPEIQSSLKQMKDGTAKSALEMELFGKSGGKFHDFLNQDIDIKQALQIVDEKGLKLTDEQVKAAIDLQIAQRDLSASLEGIWNQIGIAILLILKDLTTVITKDILPAFSTWVKEHAPALNQALRDIGKWIIEEALPALIDMGRWIQKNLIPFIRDIIKLVQENWPKISKAISDAWKIIKPILEKLGEFLFGLIDTQKKTQADAAKTWKQISKFIEDAWKIIAPILIKIFKELDKFRDEVQPKLAKAWDNIKTKIQQTWDFIWDKIIKPIVTTIQKFIEDHHEEIEKIIGGAWKQIEGIFTVAWSAIKGIVKVALDILSGDMEAAGADWQEMMSGIWSGIQLIFSGAWDILRNTVVAGLIAILTAISNQATSILNTLLAPFNNAIAAIQNLNWSAVGTSIVNAITTALNNALNVGGAVMNAIINLVTGIRDQIAAQFAFLSPNNIRDAIGFVIGNAMNAARDVGYFLLQVYNTAVGILQALADRLIIAPLQAVVNAFGTILAYALDSVLRPLGLQDLNPWKNYLPGGGLFPSQLMPAFAGAGAGSSFVNSSAITNNYYNLNISSLAPTSTLISDFGIMKSLAQGGG